MRPTSWVADEDKYKFCNDLSILELVAIGGALTAYDFQNHVASDIAFGDKFLKPENLKTQQNLSQVAWWSENNLMRLRKQHLKILGMWLQEDGGWHKNTQEYCKKAYSRLSMLTKLKYAVVQTEDLITIYKLFIRSTLEYNSVAFHSSLGDVERRGRWGE